MLTLSLHKSYSCWQHRDVLSAMVGKTFGTASAMLDGCDENELEQLTWAVYDGAL